VESPRTDEVGLAIREPGGHVDVVTVRPGLLRQRAGRSAGAGLGGVMVPGSGQG